MSLIKIGGRLLRKAGSIVPGPVGGLIRGGFALGDAVTSGAGRPAPQPMPGIALAPMPPSIPAPPPIIPPSGPRPVGPGPGSGAVTVSGVPGQVVAAAFAPAIISRLGQAFARFAQAAGGFLTLDAINQLFSQPFGNWPGDALGYFRSFMNSEGRSIIGGGMSPSGLPGFPTEIITEPIMDTINRAPRGYVIVEHEGRKIAMLKEVARKFGYWKPAAKPPISATEYRQAKAAGRVANKVARLSSALECVPKRKTTRRR